NYGAQVAIFVFKFWDVLFNDSDAVFVQFFNLFRTKISFSRGQNGEVISEIVNQRGEVVRFRSVGQYGCFLIAKFITVTVRTVYYGNTPTFCKPFYFWYNIRD